MDDAAFRRTHVAMHKLWTKAVGSDSYDKREWVELDNAILDLWKKMKGIRGVSDS